MLEVLYEEFGFETVHIVRRELTAQKGEIPSYIELLAELCLRKGPPNQPLNRTPKAAPDN